MADPNNVKSIFLTASEKPAAERSAYLDEAAGSDTALRFRVEALLKAHDNPDSFLNDPVAKFGATVDLSPAEWPLVEQPGTLIGPYKLLEQIGEGGMGVVYMADQQAPVRRRVALKIIKAGMDTRQVIARFEAERQALAMMDHANVAKVLDGGATDAGRPYFVMELVKGIPITEYSDKKNLSIRKRLELFLQVCNAVQHAHQKGLIHRDIKPTNVLVTSQDDRSMAKVIDFGVAKAIQAQLTEKTLFTEFQQLIGTPAYMSPEQAAGGLDIDTRSDVYSLGVLLYELLAGSTPFDPKELRSKSFAEMQRIIREVEPPTPSTRLNTLTDTLPSIATQRTIEPRKLAAIVRGDLDWIVMKCLEKDRSRRYESASALAADIMHHLADEPVSAAAPSRVYRIRKFVERNKLSVVATSAVLAALVIGAVGATIGMIGEARQRDEAEASREQLQAVNQFLTDDVLAAAEPSRLPDKTVRDQIIERMIDPAAVTVADRFKDKPLVEAAVRHALAGAYQSVGRSDLALPHARKSLAIRRRELGNAHPDTLESVLDLGELLQSLDMFDEATPLVREALDGHRRELGSDHKSTIVAITSMGMLRQKQGMFAEAEPLFRESLERSRRRYGDDHELTVMSINNLGWALLMQGKIAEAKPLVTEALKRARRVLNENHRGMIRATENMGFLLSAQGKFAEAESFWREGLALCRRLLGDDDPFTMDAINDLGGLLLEQGKFDETEPLAHEVLDRRRRILGENHQDTLASLNNLGNLLRRSGKLNEAEPILRDGLERARRVRGERDPNTLYAITYMGTLYMAQRRYDLAEPLLLEARRLCQTYLPATHPLTTTAICNLADLRRNQGQFDEAKQLYETALARRRRLLGDAHVDTLNVKLGMSILLQTQGHADEALPMFHEALVGYRSLFGNEHWQVGVVHMHVGRCLTSLGQYADAELELVQAERILASAQGSQTERSRSLYKDFVALYEAWDKAEPAKGYGDKAEKWRAKIPTSPPAAASTGADAGR